jgi:hypothetical protein
MAGLE